MLVEHLPGFSYAFSDNCAASLQLQVRSLSLSFSSFLCVHVVLLLLLFVCACARSIYIYRRARMCTSELHTAASPSFISLLSPLVIIPCPACRQCRTVPVCLSVPLVVNIHQYNVVAASAAAAAARFSQCSTIFSSSAFY